MKATLSNGTILEGQPSEIAKAIMEMGDVQSTFPTSEPSVHRRHASETQVVWTEAAVREFWNWLYGNQKKLMELLLKKKGSVSLDEIKERLGLNTGNQVAGILSCITRNARRETGYDQAMAYGYELKDGVWHYFVRPELIQILKKISSG